MRFLIVLVLPIAYLFLPDLITLLYLAWQNMTCGSIGPRLSVFIFLCLVAIIFMSLAGDRAGSFFRFCRLGESEKNNWISERNEIENRWEKVCYGIIYGLLAIFIVGACLYKPAWLPLNWFPDDMLMGHAKLGSRSMWIFGWSIAGLSIAAITDATRTDSGVKNPFPKYLYFYPSFLTVNSFLIYGILNLMTTEDVIYYSLAAFFSLNLGYWIDRAVEFFPNLLKALLERLKAKK